MFDASGEQEGKQEIVFSRFLQEVDAGRVKRVLIAGQEISGELASGERFVTVTPVGANLVDRLADKGVTIAAEREEGDALSLFDVFISYAPMIIFVAAWIFFMRQMQGSNGRVMGFGRSKAKLLSEMKGRVLFDDVAGVDEAKEELQEIVEFLRNPRKFQRLGGRIPKGALLVGPPGTRENLARKSDRG